jgi:LysR family transcriptional regulator, cell division regulator
MIPSSNDLHYFVEVAASLNISRAAERLGITQPSLSLAMKRLEENLGVELLVRTKTGVTLTRAGNKFNERSRLMIHQWEQIHQEAVNEEIELTGSYSIGCHESVALFSLPEMLPQLMFDYPRLEFKLLHGLSRTITDDIINFKTDFGIVVNPVKHPDLVIKELAKDVVTLWKGPGRSELMNAKNGRGVLIDFPDLIQVQSIHKQLVSKGFVFGRTISTCSLELTTALTAAGAGIGIIPSRVATRIQSMKLEMVPGAPKFHDKLCLIYRADAQKSKASRLLAGALAKCF